MTREDELGEVRDRKTISQVYRLGYEHGRRAAAGIVDASSDEPVTGHGLRLIHGGAETQP